MTKVSEDGDTLDGGEDGFSIPSWPPSQNLLLRGSSDITAFQGDGMKFNMADDAPTNGMVTFHDPDIRIASPMRGKSRSPY